MLFTQKHLSINIAYYLPRAPGREGRNAVLWFCQQASDINNLKGIALYVLRGLLLSAQ